MLSVVLLCFVTSVGQDTTVVQTTSALREALQSARPGMTVQVAPGDYQGGFMANIHGKDKSPITLIALDRNNPPRFTSGLQFSEVSHFIIDGLLIEGATNNGLNVDDGGTIKTPSHHVVIRNVTVRKTPKGNHDGIKLSGLDDFEVSRCQVEEWGGSGVDMVGCHKGKIVDCTFRNGGDSGVQAKGGTSDVVVQSCRFEDFGQRGVNIGGSTGLSFFRPPVYTMPQNQKYEAKNIRVMGSTFVRGGAPVAFVGVDGAEVRFNTFYHPGRWVMRILQETREPGFVPSRNGNFSDNLIAFRSDNWSAGGVNIGSGTAPETFTFARNFWYCEDKSNSSYPSLPSPEKEGKYGIDPLFIDAAKGDLNVAKGSTAMNHGAHALPSSDSGSRRS
ncbi:MAG: right-handed parallel beta-helix repeat-containing protein [Armatimonadetes bacterium]|nr:right-handed parallel beta-helix repeat-containing protein [Armatimonadota bacterium]